MDLPIHFLSQFWEILVESPTSQNYLSYNMKGCEKSMQNMRRAVGATMKEKDRGNLLFYTLLEVIYWAKSANNRGSTKEVPQNANPRVRFVR